MPWHTCASRNPKPIRWLESWRRTRSCQSTKLYASGSLGGAKISAREYIGALREREALKQAFEAALAGFDALLTPTTETTAVPVASVDQSKAPARFTRFANILELCGLAVPNGLTPSGLPTSLQIVCRGYCEDLALRIGWAYQSMNDWHERAP